MLYGLLNADPSRFIDNFGEIALYGLIGYAVVFLGIAFLIFIVWAVGKLLAVWNEKSNAKSTAKSEEKVEVSKKDIVTQPIVVENDEITDETVAVIMAAIMAYYEKNNPKCEFTLKRIKRM